MPSGARSYRALFGDRHKLLEEFESILEFLAVHPDLAPSTRRAGLGQPAANRALAQKFLKGRNPVGMNFRAPETCVDPAVVEIFSALFGTKQDLSAAFEKHKVIMAMENRVGALLEEYLSTKICRIGWIWCSGSVVRSVDFIRRTGTARGDWLALQIKNRDNSENSSSAKVRDGKNILHWFRVFSKTGQTNWGAFPDARAGELLCEEDFISYVKARSVDRRQET